MNKKMFIIGTLLLGAAAAAWWIKGQINLMSKLLYSVKRYSVKSISRNGIVILLEINLQNKGALAIDIIGYDIDVYGDGNFLVRVVSGKEVSIKPFSDSVMPLELIINPKLLASGLGGALTGSEDWKNIRIEMKGTIKVRKGIIPFPIPFKYGYTVKELSEFK